LLKLPEEPVLLIPIYVVATATGLYGFFVAGWLGVASPLVVGYLVASVYAGRLSRLSPLVAPIASTLGKVQRLSAAWTIALIAIGVVVGGWRWAWAGAVAGYAFDFLFGASIALTLLRLVGQKGSS
jgi:hypothetical protein